MVARHGFEPRLTGPEPVVLPLNDRASALNMITVLQLFVNLNHSQFLIILDNNGDNIYVIWRYKHEQDYNGSAVC